MQYSTTLILLTLDKEIQLSSNNTQSRPLLAQLLEFWEEIHVFPVLDALLNQLC